MPTSRVKGLGTDAVFTRKLDERQDWCKEILPFRTCAPTVREM
jgi:hypothetical protein